MIIYTLLLKDEKFSEKEIFLLNFLSEMRREKVLRFVYDMDKKLSLYSALMARMVISGQSGILPHDLMFGLQKNGKPYLLNEKGIHFNLSHTRNAIIGGFAREEIGVDVEKIDVPDASILPVCFHESETERFYHTREADRSSLFYKIWTRKEAYIKFTGQGLCEDITKIDTFEPKLERNFMSWSEAGYIFSVYSEEEEKQIEKVKLETGEIVDWYRNQSLHPSQRE